MHGPGDVRLFDRFARVYDLLVPPVRGSRLAEGLARAGRPVERVLDVGGGTGRAAAAVDAPERIVVDISLPMLRRATARAGLDALRGDAARLPFREGSVDAVLVVEAFHHLPNQQGALRAATRVLAPGGVLVVREFDPGTPQGALIERVETLVGMGSRFRRPAELASMFEEAGLDPSILEARFDLGFTAVGVKPLHTV